MKDKMTATEVMSRRVGLVYGEVSSMSKEDWKSVSEVVMYKYGVVSVKETNPNVLFKMKQQSVLPRAEKIYVKPPIGPRHIFKEDVDE